MTARKRKEGESFQDYRKALKDEDWLQRGLMQARPDHRTEKAKVTRARMVAAAFG